MHVVFAMGWADFVLKYRGSALGYLWSLVVPLVKFLVMLHVFRPFVSDIPYYPLYLFLGLILWEHFSLTTSACIGMLQDKAAIIKKVIMPRVLLILAVGWTHIIILCTYLLIFFSFCLFLGAGIPVVTLWYLPLLLVQSTFIALGIGMILSSYALKYRDIQHLWGVLLQVIFWLTPIMYAYKPDATLFSDLKTLLSGTHTLSFWSIFDIFIRFQPLSILTHDARRAFLYSAELNVPSWVHIGAFTATCAILFAAGFLVFQNRSKYFIEEY